MFKSCDITCLRQGDFMKLEKIQVMDMHLKRISNYSSYIDSFTRILREFIENGDYNIKPIDTVNLAVLLEKYSHRLHLCVLNTLSDWEFYGK